MTAPATITIAGTGGNAGATFTLCSLPQTPGFATAEIAQSDAVGVVTSPFTRQEQTQYWAGGDYWEAAVTVPSMTPKCAAAWRGFLADLRGRLNVFQLSDPSQYPFAYPSAGAPVVNSSVDTYNLPMTYNLVTRGWAASSYGLLQPGQQIQIGYRLYMVCGGVPVNSDSSGNATFNVFPTIRETPPDGTAITLIKPQGLFRLSMNRRAIQWSPDRLTTLSFKCVEAK